ncbi:MAG: hypothetical protein JWO78_2048 [Micavibrio sp.]|nr:hypothetical protein [Micavibrio sp.]
MTTMAQSMERGTIVVLQTTRADMSSLMDGGVLSREFIAAVQTTKDAEVTINEQGMTIKANADDFRRLAWIGGLDASPLKIAYNEANKTILAYEKSNVASKLLKLWWSYTNPVSKATVDVPGILNTRLTIKKYGF